MDIEETAKANVQGETQNQNDIRMDISTPNTATKSINDDTPLLGFVTPILQANNSNIGSAESNLNNQVKLKKDVEDNLEDTATSPQKMDQTARATVQEEARGEENEEIEIEKPEVRHIDSQLLKFKLMVPFVMEEN